MPIPADRRKRENLSEREFITFIRLLHQPASDLASVSLQASVCLQTGVQLVHCSVAVSRLLVACCDERAAVPIIVRLTVAREDERVRLQQ